MGTPTPLDAPPKLSSFITQIENKVFKFKLLASLVVETGLSLCHINVTSSRRGLKIFFPWKPVT